MRLGDSKHPGAVDAAAPRVAHYFDHHGRARGVDPAGAPSGRAPTHGAAPLSEGPVCVRVRARGCVRACVRAFARACRPVGQLVKRRQLVKRSHTGPSVNWSDGVNWSNVAYRSIDQLVKRRQLVKRSQTGPSVNRSNGAPVRALCHPLPSRRGRHRERPQNRSPESAQTAIFARKWSKKKRGVKERRRPRESRRIRSRPI